jgi:hypothetical protein
MFVQWWVTQKTGKHIMLGTLNTSLPFKNILDRWAEVNK